MQREDDVKAQGEDSCLQARGEPEKSSLLIDPLSSDV